MLEGGDDIVSKTYEGAVWGHITCYEFGGYDSEWAHAAQWAGERAAADARSARVYERNGDHEAAEAYARRAGMYDAQRMDAYARLVRVRAGVVSR